MWSPFWIAMFLAATSQWMRNSKLKTSTFPCHIFSSFSFPSRVTLLLFPHFPNVIFNFLIPESLLTEEIGNPLAFYETQRLVFYVVDL